MKRALIGRGLVALMASLAPWTAAARQAPASPGAGTPPHIAAPIGPGDDALDFSLLDAAGMSHMLEDYRGKLVLLWFLGYG